MVIRMDWPFVAGGGDIERAWAAWLQGLADALGPGLILMGVVLTGLLFLVPLNVPRVVHRRCFWCAQARRDVEVEFEESGLPGFRRALAVRRCSVFDPASAVRCKRRCLDSAFRRLWEPGFPVHGRQGG